MPSEIWSFKQQGYVQANSSWMYSCNYDVLTDSFNDTHGGVFYGCDDVFNSFPTPLDKQTCQGGKSYGASEGRL